MLPRQLPPQFFIFGIVIAALIVLIQIEVFSLVLSRLGLSPTGASLLLIVSLIGSAVNLPVLRLNSNYHYDATNPLHKTLPHFRFTEGHTLIAINVGGALIPVVFSGYLIVTSGIPIVAIVLAILAVSIISFLFSRPIANMGIGMPLFVAPLSAALTAMLLSREHAAALAYICGSLGVVIGADLMRTRDIKALNTPIASIGGAGTFDGIFMTGLIAVLLTY